MDQAVNIFVYLTGISYAVVGIYLLHLASRTRGIPERYLGLAFLFNGISYGLSEIPYVFGVEGFLAELSFLGRISAGACVIAIAVFTYRVFRSDSKWARRLVWIDAVLIASALGVSAIEGDWAGMEVFSSFGFWMEWVGSSAAFVWLSVEALQLYLVARKRVPLGLIDPLVCNRYFLIGLYGVLATATYVIAIPSYITYHRHGTWSPSLDLGLGVVELVSVIALSMSFRAPAFYRRWVGGPEANAS